MICGPQYFMGMNGRIYFMRYCMSLIYIPHIISAPRKDAPFGTYPISARKISIEKYPVEKRRAVGASLRVHGLYSPNYIHPNYISPDHFASIIFPQLYPARPFRPKISRRKYPVEKGRAVGASLRVGDLYTPHLHALIYIPHIISTPKNIRPEKYPPRKYPPRKYPPRVETRHSARLQYPRKTCRRFIYPTFACVDLYTPYYIRPKNIRPKNIPPRVKTRHSARLQYPRKTFRRFIYPIFACVDLYTTYYIHPA